MYKRYYLLLFVFNWFQPHFSNYYNSIIHRHSILLFTTIVYIFVCLSLKHHYHPFLHCFRYVNRVNLPETNIEWMNNFEVVKCASPLSPVRLLYKVLHGVKYFGNSVTLSSKYGTKECKLSFFVYVYCRLCIHRHRDLNIH